MLYSGYPTEDDTESLRPRLLVMQGEFLVLPRDAVVASKQNPGAIKLNQPAQPPHSGALSAALRGSLIGRLFAAPRAGAAVGAPLSGGVGLAMDRQRRLRREQPAAV